MCWLGSRLGSLSTVLGPWFYLALESCLCAPLCSLRVDCSFLLTFLLAPPLFRAQGNVIFALPFVPGHAPLHVTDILGLLFVLTGLLVYRFGPEFVMCFASIGASGSRVAKTTAVMQGRTGGRGSLNDDDTALYALGEHRKPLLDLAEEGDEFLVEDSGRDRTAFGDGRRDRGRGGREAGATRGIVKKPAKKVVETEWEM